MSKFIINSKTNACRTFGQFIKGLHYGLHILKIEPKFSSSSFVIRANVLHLEPFLFLYGLVVSLIFFSVLVNYCFQVYSTLNIFVVCGQTDNDRVPVNFDSSNEFLATFQL